MSPPAPPSEWYWIMLRTKLNKIILGVTLATGVTLRLSPSDCAEFISKGLFQPWATFKSNDPIVCIFPDSVFYIINKELLFSSLVSLNQVNKELEFMTDKEIIKILFQFMYPVCSSCI